jgi:hypothetical protein
LAVIIPPKKNKIEQILDIFSHTQSANTNYHEPSDYLKIDFNFKPLIKTGKLKIFGHG